MLIASNEILEEILSGKTTGHHVVEECFLMFHQSQKNRVAFFLDNFMRGSANAGGGGFSVGFSRAITVPGPLPTVGTGVSEHLSN
jgi:hypothetical protein